MIEQNCNQLLLFQTVRQVSTGHMYAICVWRASTQRQICAVIWWYTLERSRTRARCVGRDSIALATREHTCWPILTSANEIISILVFDMNDQTRSSFGLRTTLYGCDCVVFLYFGMDWSYVTICEHILLYLHSNCASYDELICPLLCPSSDERIFPEHLYLLCNNVYKWLVDRVIWCENLMDINNNNDVTLTCTLPVVEFTFHNWTFKIVLHNEHWKGNECKCKK